MDVPVEKKIKTKKTKKSKVIDTEKSITDCVDEIKTDEKQILEQNNEIQYGKIDKQKDVISHTIKKIENVEETLNKKEQEITQNNASGQIISEKEFNDRISFIEKYQDVESFDTEELIEIYKKLNQYVEDCKTFIDSTNMNVEYY